MKPAFAKRPRERLLTRNSVRVLEHQIQLAVFDWRRCAQGQMPVLKLLYAVPNGAGLRHTVKRKLDGSKVRYSQEGQKLRREGMTAGVPDVCLPAARGPYHGLYIEHKTDTGTVSQEQKAFMDGLLAEGYCVLISRDALTTISLITAYVALGTFDPASAGLPVATSAETRPRGRRRGSAP